MAAPTMMQVAVLSVADSSFAKLGGGLRQLGSDTIFVTPSSKAMLASADVATTVQDIRSLASVSGVAEVAPFAALNGSVSACGSRLIVTIRGATPEHFSLEGLSLADGRAITDVDVEARERVVVIC